MQPLLAAIIMIVCIVLFFTEKVPILMVPLIGALLSGLTGLIPFSDVFADFASNTAILMISMSIVGAAMFQTGLAQKVAGVVTRIGGGSERSIILIAVLSSTVLSGIFNGTSTFVTLCPIITAMCVANKVPVSRVYFALSYGVIFGSLLTLIGSSMGPISSGVLEEAGYEPLGFFEPAMLGAPFAICGVIYLLTIGRKFLPDTNAMPEKMVGGKEAQNATPAKLKISAVVLIAIILTMVLQPENLPFFIIAAVGAVVLVLTGCLNTKQFLDAIPWQTIYILGGMSAVGNAIENSGAGEIFANAVVSVYGSFSSPIILLAVVYLTTTILTQFLSNSTSAIIMAPIALLISQAVGTSAEPFVIAAYAGSISSFCTPIATNVLTFIYEPGQYKWRHYLKMGIGMQIIYFVVSMVLIPIIWPFH
ncbi:SLC13 family permease [Angelakisella massiliensis]|uniref:SLC13 family permease n=1 Tax=Angelakisella massiliensis TaxID=1871018 RepID=UPI0008F96E62|nr:SLC13 family permease [Angelakisella massiliensis]